MLKYFFFCKKIFFLLLFLLASLLKPTRHEFTRNSIKFCVLITKLSNAFEDQLVVLCSFIEPIFIFAPTRLVSFLSRGLCHGFKQSVENRETYEQPVALFRIRKRRIYKQSHDAKSEINCGYLFPEYLFLSLLLDSLYYLSNCITSCLYYVCAGTLHTKHKT